MEYTFDKKNYTINDKSYDISEVIDLYEDENKLAALKKYREITGTGLADSKLFIDQLPSMQLDAGKPDEAAEAAETAESTVEIKESEPAENEAADGTSFEAESQTSAESGFEAENQTSIDNSFESESQISSDVNVETKNQSAVLDEEISDMTMDGSTIANFGAETDGKSAVLDEITKSDKAEEQSENDTSRFDPELLEQSDVKILDGAKTIEDEKDPLAKEVKSSDIKEVQQSLNNEGKSKSGVLYGALGAIAIAVVCAAYYLTTMN